MLCACWQHHRGALETRGVFPAWKVRKTSLREVSNTEVQEPSVLWPQAQTTCPFQHRRRECCSNTHHSPEWRRTLQSRSMRRFAT